MCLTKKISENAIVFLWEFVRKPKNATSLKLKLLLCQLILYLRLTMGIQSWIHTVQVFYFLYIVKLESGTLKFLLSVTQAKKATSNKEIGNMILILDKFPCVLSLHQLRQYQNQIQKIFSVLFLAYNFLAIPFPSIVL